MLHIFTATKTAIFIGGAAVGAIGSGALRSKAARKLAVNGIAKGIMLKDSIKEQVENLKEEAEDICIEAKQKAMFAAMDALDALDALDPFDFDFECDDDEVDENEDNIL